MTSNAMRGCAHGGLRLVAGLVAALCVMASCENQDDPPPTFPMADQCYYWGPSLVFFDTGKAELNQTSTRSLDLLVADWRIDGGRFSVVGHTDSVGATSANRLLALSRASRVKDYLVKAGVPASNVELRAYASEQPLVQTPPQTAEPQNRRVEISWKGERNSCAEKIIKVFDDWYARNCRPAPRLGQGKACASVREYFGSRYE